MNVKSIMTNDPASCTPRTPVQEIAQLMLQNDCGEIPVVESNGSRRPIGVVTDRDIAVRVVAQGRDLQGTAAADCMTSPVVTVEPETSLKDCCDLMEMHKIRRVPVVDEQGDLCGMVSLADIALKGRDRTTIEVVKEVSEPTGDSQFGARA